MQKSIGNLQHAAQHGAPVGRSARKLRLLHPRS